MEKFYAFESDNGSAVGPFPTKTDCDTWIENIVPPEDRYSEEASSGYRSVTHDFVIENDGLFESPAEAETRYRECYAEYYPGFTPKA